MPLCGKHAVIECETYAQYACFRHPDMLVRLLVHFSLLIYEKLLGQDRALI